MIFSKKCDIIPLGKSHKSLEMQKNLVQNSGTRWYFSCTVYIFSADDIFRKVAENPEKSTILANILRYLQIYIPAGPHWGGRGRKFKSCHSDQKSGVVRFPIFLCFIRLFGVFERVSKTLFFMPCYAGFRGVLRKMLRKGVILTTPTITPQPFESARPGLPPCIFG